jgi:protein import protein ZIM17
MKPSFILPKLKADCCNQWNLRRSIVSSSWTRHRTKKNETQNSMRLVVVPQSPNLPRIQPQFQTIPSWNCRYFTIQKDNDNHDSSNSNQTLDDAKQTLEEEHINSEEGQSSSSSSSSAPSLQVTQGTDETIQVEIPGTQTTNKGRKLAIVFTCTVCNTRSAKQFTQHAYEHGVVLIRCPGCKNLHLIADRLGWFDDTESGTFDLSTLEQMTGQKVRRIGDDTIWNLKMEDLVGHERLQHILQQQTASTTGDGGGGTTGEESPHSTK